MHDLAQTAAAELARFLLAHLRALGADWWTTHVEAHLSFQQQRTVQQRGIRTLDQLDLAALLRVFVQNWHDLSEVLKLPREARNLARELQTVRDKWAHLPAQPVPPNDVYRDADTVVRFLEMLGAKRESVAVVEAARTAAFQDMVGALGAAPTSAPIPRAVVIADHQMPDAGEP